MNITFVLIILGSMVALYIYSIIQEQIELLRRSFELADELQELVQPFITKSKRNDDPFATLNLSRVPEKMIGDMVHTIKLFFCCKSQIKYVFTQRDTFAQAVMFVISIDTALKAWLEEKGSKTSHINDLD